MFQTTALYVALAVFGFGLIFKISTWFRHTAGIDTSGTEAWRRVQAAVRTGIDVAFGSPRQDKRILAPATWGSCDPAVAQVSGKKVVPESLGGPG